MKASSRQAVARANCGHFSHLKCVHRDHNFVAPRCQPFPVGTGVGTCARPYPSKVRYTKSRDTWHIGRWSHPLTAGFGLTSE